MKELVVIIDGDAIAHRASSAVETSRWRLYPDGKDSYSTTYPKGTRKKDIPRTKGSVLERVTTIEDVSHACQIAKNFMLKIKQAMEGYYEIYKYIVYLSDSNKNDPRYKQAVTIPYKGNRPNKRPKHLTAVREYLIKQHGAEICPGEADDMIASTMSFYVIQEDFMPIAVHIDKDIDQVPGRHYNFVTGESYTIDPLQAQYNWAMLMLTGDTSDNIPGLKGVGKKTAEKILLKAQESGAGPVAIADTVYNAYIERGYPGEYYEEMRSLVTLRKLERLSMMEDDEEELMKDWDTIVSGDGLGEWDNDDEFNFNGEGG